jgi:hypothetical protein
LRGALELADAGGEARSPGRLESGHRVHPPRPRPHTGCWAALAAHSEFHGGTGISLQVISRTAVGLGLLVLPGVLLTALIVALVVSPAFGVGFPVALLVGAVLAATDPAILIPLFDRLKLRPKVSQTVIAESAFNDVTGTVLTLTLVGAVEAGRFTFSGPALEFTKELVLGALIGVVAGAVLCYAVSSTARAGIWDESPGVAIFAVVKVMIPSPPNCISTIISSSPKWVKVSGIATVERPVTVLQLTATKNALTKEIPSVVAHGSLSDAVPPPRARGILRL